MLAQLQRRWPFLRVVISGRAPVTTLKLAGAAPKQLELGKLDAESATAILVRDGVSDKKLARRLVDLVGAIPLSLKLAAELYKREAEESGGLKDLKRNSRFWISASASVIQGQLYDRILGHIHNEQVRRLAHPGLVLRRVTPEVIFHVLNGTCELGLDTLAQAKELFEKLEQETSLVKRDDLEGALVHRADLRRVMLDLLRQREPARVRRIHEAAVAWYSRQTDLRSRAESVYHRLCLEQRVPPTELEHTEIRSSIQASIVELPESMQTMLASYGFEVPREILDKTSREQRDSRAAARVEELLPHGAAAASELAGVLIEIGKQLDRATPLFRAAARIHLAQKQDKSAADCLEDGLTFATSEGKSALIMELLAEKAWAVALRNEHAELAPTLDGLKDYAERHGSVLFRTQERLQRLGALEPRAAGEGGLARDIARLFTGLGPRELWGLLPALRDPLGVLVRGEPDCIKRIGELVVAEDSPFFFKQHGWGTSMFRGLDLVAEAAWGLLKVNNRATSAHFVDMLRDLCDVWPYRILHVRQPYSPSRGGVLSERAAA
jgi:hypothetical protein